MKNFIIIQARITSSRFPEKIFFKINNKMILEYVLEQAILVPNTKTIIAVPEDQINLFQSLKEKYNIEVFGGSEEDVLLRYYYAALNFGAENIIRITSDCPLIRYEIINDCLNFFLSQKNIDYCINTSLETFYKDKKNEEIKYKTNTLLSDGFDVEIFTFNILERAHQNAKSKSEREHMTIWMKENGKCFIYDKSFLYINGKFSVDHPDDIEITKAFLTLYNKGYIKVGEI